MRTKYLNLILLILAGELIFALPFHITRFFKPTVLEVFQITNTDLGDAFALYGILALLCYFPGGYLADKYPPRKLISLSLFFTGIGGLYFATLPSATLLPFVYAYWGITTILLFWGALIKYTNDWGGLTQQGKAFGYLEAGRGLVASIFSSIAFLLLYFISKDMETASRSAVQIIIMFYSISIIILSCLIYRFLKDYKINKNIKNKSNTNLRLRLYPVFLISVIVICAYCGFRSVDNMALYLVEIGKFTTIEAAGFVTTTSYLRIIFALLAGIIADRITSIKLVIVLFTIVIIGQGVLVGFNPQNVYQLVLISANLILVFISIISLRAVYFSLVKHSHISFNRTGFSVGIISLVGFTPDIFFHSLTGRILDAEPGIIGFQNYHFVVMVISILGLLASLKLSKWIARETRLECAGKNAI